MKLRATMEIEIEVSDEKAQKQFGTADPYAVASEMQREALQHAQGEAERMEHFTVLGCSVRPHYG